MSLEIRPIKCQSCGSGSLDFSISRFAKCSHCSTTHVMSGWNEATDALQETTKGKATIEIPIQILVGLFLREQGVVFTQGLNMYTDFHCETPQLWIAAKEAVSLDSHFSIYRKEAVPVPWGPFNLLKKRRTGFRLICELSVFDSPKIPFSMGVYKRSAMPDCEHIIGLLRQGMNVEVRATLLVS